MLVRDLVWTEDRANWFLRSQDLQRKGFPFHMCGPWRAYHMHKGDGTYSLVSPRGWNSDDLHNLTLFELAVVLLDCELLPQG